MDYKELGFKCGIEIHQQLDGKKLFCDCLTLNSTKKPDMKLVRKLRVAAGETGMVDKAAAYEMAKDKEFIYVSSSEDTCLVEFDEEPPHPINIDALNTCIMVAKLLNAKIVDEIQVMRKTVIDGSNVSGFQRTALVAVDGYIETSLGKVGVPTICLEEEAAQKLESDGDSVSFKLDRLGIPLIEIGTDPDIKNPEHAKEVSAYLGMILRSTGKVKRGLGTIRQDVNISIKGGARTEIKGFQDLKSIPKVIEFEVKRQMDEIKKGKKIEPAVRKAEPDFTTSFLRPMPGADRMYPETDVETILITKSMIDSIRVPELIDNKLDNLVKRFNISKDHAKKLDKKDMLDSFTEFSGKFSKIKPGYIADLFLSYENDIKKLDGKADVSKIDKVDFEKVFFELDNGNIPKDAVMNLLLDKALGKKMDISKYEMASEDDVLAEIKKIVEEKPGLNKSGYMGLIMAKLKGKVDGKTAMKILDHLLI